MLNNDIIMEIMIRSTTNTIKSLCLTNKRIYSLGYNTLFRKNKYEYLLTNDYQVFEKSHNLNQWLNNYKKMANCKNLAVQWIDYIMDSFEFNFFAATVDVPSLLWLPNL